MSAGLQLIERNDELCILYERANVQEATLKKGHINLTSREAERRMLKLELKEANRQIEVRTQHLRRYLRHVVVRSFLF